MLNGGTTVFAAGLDLEPLRELHLLTAKPFLYVFNVDDEEMGNETLKDEMRALVAPAEAIFLDAKIESELARAAPTTRPWSCCSPSARRSPGSRSSPGSASRRWACRPT